MKGQSEPVTVYTIGHGSRSISEFIALLVESGVQRLVDVRRWPSSRRHPQFSREALGNSLAGAHIRYVWEGETLGGRRRPTPTSPHIALRDEMFRGYADHMLTAGFLAVLRVLIDTSCSEPTAIMCAERLPQRCHRSLISDNLCIRGIEVKHIVEPGTVRAHTIDNRARRVGDTLIYDRGHQPALGGTDGKGE